MKNKKSIFVCNVCAAEYPKWLGKCRECNSWNSISEELKADITKPIISTTINYDNKILPITKIKTLHEKRQQSNIGEIDRVLGGGLVQGSLILLSGDPGIGKSTLLMQILYAYAKQNFKVLYISAEESCQQIKIRAERLNTMHDNILLLNENNMDIILDAITKILPDVLVIDSIQTVHSQNFPSSAGSVTQVRECTNLLLEPSKNKGISTFIIGHVTKEGSIAGPRILEHLVDSVLYLEGDITTGNRILRSIKNRFGSTGEIGIFSMTNEGLMEVNNPSLIFIGDHHNPVPGCAITVCLEGSRPLLVELQALVGKSVLGNPRRFVTGIDPNRLAILTAILEKRAGLYLANNDIYASVTGGLKLQEPSIDMALAMAISSSLLNKTIAKHTVFIGEVALSGEIRPISQLMLRINEAIRMGSDNIYIPAQSFNIEKEAIHKLITGLKAETKIIPVNNIFEIASIQK